MCFDRAVQERSAYYHQRFVYRVGDARRTSKTPWLNGHPNIFSLVHPPFRSWHHFQAGATVDTTRPTQPSIPPWQSGVGKWVPASAWKEKAGMVNSVSGWTRDVQVKLWDHLRTRAIPERLRGVFTTRCYTFTFTSCRGRRRPINTWKGILSYLDVRLHVQLVKDGDESNRQNWM